MLPKGPMVWNLGRASQRSKDWILDVLPRGPRIEFWTCFLEVRGFERASQRFDGLKFGRAFQRSVDLNLDMLPRGPMD